MDFYRRHLDKLKAENRLRQLPEDNPGLIDLVSNDYLGLASREFSLREEFFKLYPDASFSSSASRLLSRKQKYHLLLEDLLRELYSKDILLFNSGYHANTGLISALSTTEALFLTDELMHASGLDGLMLGQFHRKSRMVTFAHNDISDLEEKIKIERSKSNTSDIFIVTESIFSMDGDKAPLQEMVSLKYKYNNIRIYLDEAHGFGIRGKRGLGLAEESGVMDEIDFIVGTFGKALASEGAFVATSPLFKTFFINSSRSFIFSTAIPPLNTAWSHFMLTKILGMNKERLHLKELGKFLRGALIPSSKLDTHIVPLICGSASKAIDLSIYLRNNGYDTLPIRRPTVPAGTERIRLSLNAGLTFHSVKALVFLLEKFSG